MKLEKIVYRRCRYITVALILLSLSGVVLAKQQPTPVIISEVKTVTFFDRVEALGTLRANESVDISATITDTITAIHFEDGQRVKAGDILVELTSKEEHAELEEELSTLAEAEKQFKRIKPLMEKNAVAPTLLDQRRRDFEGASARYRQIESRLQDRLIVAPFSGVVGLRNISIGALVEPGDMITTLDDDSVMKLDFTVPAIHLETLKEGLEIEATASAFGDRTFTGKISSISSRIDENTRSIMARAVLDNPGKLLKPGMLMTVVLLKNPRKALVIAEEALLPAGRSNSVLVIDNSIDSPTTQKRKVTIGKREVGQVEILQGLKEGEFVVVHGALRTRPGAPVKILGIEKGEGTLEEILNRKNEVNN